MIINDDLLLKYAKETLEIEINEAKRMLARLNKNIVIACRILLHCKGKVVVSGIGKSGHVGRKIAASLASTGTPAFFVHPAEALHGDLGMIEDQDVVLFISYSGCAYEIVTLLPIILNSRIPIIACTGNVDSPLASKATCVLDIEIQKEACPMELAPTSSMVNALMMGDALTIALMRYKGFSLEQFARFHPGGKLGAQLLNNIHHLMRTGINISKVFQNAIVMEAMFELSRTGLGLTAICNKNMQVIGVFTDGDLRRWMVQGRSLNDPIGDAMTTPGYCVFENWHSSVVLEMLHRKKITAAPVINECGELVGSINVHDLQQATNE